MATGSIILAFHAADGEPAYHARRVVAWPGVPRVGDTISCQLLPDDDQYYPVETVSWDPDGDCVVYLGRIQLDVNTRAIAIGMSDEAGTPLAWWKSFLERSGWEVTSHPWPAE